jgi:hypothetical protein
LITQIWSPAKKYGANKFGGYMGLTVWAGLAALAFFVLFAAFLFVLGLEDGKPKGQVAVRIGRGAAFFLELLLLFAHQLY